MLANNCVNGYGKHELPRQTPDSLVVIYNSTGHDISRWLVDRIRQ
ncbi:MAG: hypothetical protein WBA93_17380 [Microcoleaceae cyanobacterium]